ncbi:MAG: hypothetical protein K0Q87_3426 [Neobacillus sp.]|jgi:hypothetical protein|nr:hypothetical protein [Neobacillus sp.]
MKKITIIIILLFSFSNLCFPQAADINLADIELFPSAGSEIENGRVVLYNTGQPFIPYKVLARVKLQRLGPIYQYKGSLFYQYYAITDEFLYNPVAIGNNTLYGSMVEKIVNIPSNAPKLDSIRAQASAPGIAMTPTVYSRKGIQIKIVDIPNFIGPYTICSEPVTYTIERPGTITLANAAGVATLTSLGNNQWKITNIGGAGVAKIIKLRSTSNGRTYDKDIIVGGGYATSIQGPSSGHGGEMFEFTMEYIGQGTIKWKSNSTLVDMSFGDTGPTLLIGTTQLLHNQTNKQVLIEGIFTSSCGVVTQINKTLTLNP